MVCLECGSSRIENIVVDHTLKSEVESFQDFDACKKCGTVFESSRLEKGTQTE